LEELWRPSRNFFLPKVMNSFAGRSLDLSALFDREKAGMPVKRVK
jgi:hypothetical protein